VELSYALGRPYWGNGYATEAGRTLVAYAFETLGLARIAYGVDGANTRSVGVMRRLGFRLERNLHPNGAEDVVGVLDNDRPERPASDPWGLRVWGFSKVHAALRCAWRT